MLLGVLNKENMSHNMLVYYNHNCTRIVRVVDKLPDQLINANDISQNRYTRMKQRDKGSNHNDNFMSTPGIGRDAFIQCLS